jgi:large subunit ribosomal protein L27
MMAHKKAQGATKNGKDSAGRRRGVKRFGGEKVIPGNIVVRQLGTKFYPGENVGMGKDYTIFSTENGTVHFSYKIVNGKKRCFVNVISC